MSAPGFRTIAASEPRPGHDNEDWMAAGDGWAVVLDGHGVSAADTSCVHGIRWFVETLGTAIGLGLSESAAAGRRPVLADLLAEAIDITRGEHGGACDLDGPRSPAASLAIVSRHFDTIDHLVLGETAVVANHAGRTVALTGGIATPPVASDAGVGTLPVAETAAIGLFTSGAIRPVRYFGWSWERLAGVTDHYGPESLIHFLRKWETGNSVPDGPMHDDATAIWCVPDEWPLAR